MKPYKVIITTMFVKEIVVIANDCADAKQKAEQAIWDGEVDGTDTNDFTTNVIVVGDTATEE